MVESVPKRATSCRSCFKPLEEYDTITGHFRCKKCRDLLTTGPQNESPTDKDWKHRVLFILRMLVSPKSLQ